MTSGSGVNYKSMFDAGSQIIAKEGTKSLFKGAGANILRGVAGAGVLSLYDKLQQVMFGKVYAGGKHMFFSSSFYTGLIENHRIWLKKNRQSNRAFCVVLVELVFTLISYRPFLSSSTHVGYGRGGQYPSGHISVDTKNLICFQA